MDEVALHEDVEAALARLTAKHRGLREALDEAYGYAVFPSVGRASAVVGVSAGDGEVFEHGRAIGFAQLRQLTAGVQLGGQTFGELLFFASREVLERFKAGPVTFTASSSAVILKAAAMKTSGLKGVRVAAFGEGGELLELSLGGQKFNFQPAASVSTEQEAGESGGAAHRRPGLASRLLSRLRRRGNQTQGQEEAGEPHHPA